MANWSTPSASVWLDGLFYLAVALSLAKLALVAWGSPAAGAAGATPPPGQNHGPTPPNPVPEDVDVNYDAIVEAPAPEDTPVVDVPSADTQDEGAATDADRWLAENDLGHHRDLLQRLGKFENPWQIS